MNASMIVFVFLDDPLPNSSITVSGFNLLTKALDWDCKIESSQFVR